MRGSVRSHYDHHPIIWSTTGEKLPRMTGANGVAQAANCTCAHARKSSIERGSFVPLFGVPTKNKKRLFKSSLCKFHPKVKTLLDLACNFSDDLTSIDEDNGSVFGGFRPDTGHLFVD